MCLIVFAYDCHPVYQLILGANRDEFRDRPTEPAGFWADAPTVLAGRDKRAGGTWLGVTTGGRLAAITNYRDARQQVVDPPSRGTMVAGFLKEPRQTPEDFLGVLTRDGGRYDGFNLLYGTTSDLHYFTNRGGSSGPVSPGIHVLTNHLLDTGWPKANVARARLEAIVQHAEIEPDQIFTALADPAPFAVGLPDTGIGPERERLLSPVFIDGEEYGTRSTTVLLVGRNGHVDFVERTFSHTQQEPTTKRYTFTVRSV